MRLQALDGIHDALLQRNPVNLQHPVRLRVVDLVPLVLRRHLPALNIVTRQLILVLGEVLPHDIRNVPVTEPRGRGEQAVTSGLGHLQPSLDVRRGDIADVDPARRGAGGCYLVLPLPLDELDDALVGRVDGLQAGEVVHDGAKDHGRVHRGEVELGVVGRVLDKVPGGLLGQRLGDTVRRCGVLVHVLFRDRVPGLLREGRVGVCDLLLSQDGGEGGGHDHAADLGC
jgi:hypothetical protein